MWSFFSRLSELAYRAANRHACGRVSTYYILSMFLHAVSRSFLFATQLLFKFSTSPFLSQCLHQPIMQSHNPIAHQVLRIVSDGHVTNSPFTEPIFLTNRPRVPAQPSSLSTSARPTSPQAPLWTSPRTLKPPNRPMSCEISSPPLEKGGVRSTGPKSSTKGKTWPTPGYSTSKRKS